MRRAYVIIAACLGSWNAPLAAQPLTALRGDTARIELGAVATDLVPSGATPVERSGARRSHRLAGAVVGFAVSAGGLYVWMDSNEFCDPSDNQDAIGVRECLALAGLAGVGGAALGALIGHFVRTERREIPLESLRIGLAPAARGVAVQVSVFR